jgi:HSP20 family protein
MPLIPYRPFWDLDKWFEDEWPERSGWGRLTPLIRSPRMDIYEDAGNVIAEVELPGLDPKDINIEVKDNFLKVEAKTGEKKEEKKKGYYRKEMSQGFYRRVVPLPVEVKGEKASATYKEGILKVAIPKIKPKKEKKKGVKIKVKGTKEK